MDRRLLARAAFWLGSARLALWLVPFQSLLTWIDRMHNTSGSSANYAAAGRIAWAVKVASRYVPGTRSCLPRALATTILLRRAGLPAQLRLGLARGEDGHAEAHAWVESEGRVIMGADELERYIPFSALKGAGH